MRDFFVFGCVQALSHNRAKGQPIVPRCLTVVQGTLLAISAFMRKIVEPHHHTKTDVVVPVLRVVVVADRNTGIVFIVVPRAATQTL
jgi:hypothetical protein